MDTKLELLYKEKVRLNELVDKYTEKQPLMGLKILGGIGALFVWEPFSRMLISWRPVSDSLIYAHIPSTLVLLVGFLIIKIAIILIGLEKTVKGLRRDFYLDEIQIFEEEIRRGLRDYDLKAFHTVDNWKEKERPRQNIAGLPYSILFMVIVGIFTFVFPMFILYINEYNVVNCQKENFGLWFFPLLYFLLALAITCGYFKTVSEVAKHYPKSSKPTQP